MNHIRACSYDQYKLEFVKNWAHLISARAGCEPSKGGRGKKNSPLRELCANLSAGLEYNTWQRYRSGAQSPCASRMRQLHERAVELGYLGQGSSLKAIQERSGMMSESEWEFWTFHEGKDPSEKERDKLRARLSKLEREAASIKKRLQELDNY